MPGGKKSRSGCARCKEKRLRCDETKPACNRCLRARETCPGYQRSLRWSSKHEICSFLSPEAERVSRVVDAEGASVEDIQYTEAEIGLGMQSASPLVLDLHDDLLFGCPLLPVSGLEYNGLMPADTQDGGSMLLSDNVFQLQSTPWDNLATSSTIQYLPDSAPIYPILIHTEHALVEFYFKEVAIIYSCYDGEMNPFRSIMARLWSTSADIAKTLQSMAAACLSQSYPHLASQGYKLRQEVYTSITTRPQSGHLTGISLLVAIMLGQTAGWHNPKDLGLTYYRRSKELLQYLESDTSALQESAIGKDITFFQNAIGYWEMLLSFIMPKEQVYPLTKLSVKANSTRAQIEPHPWTLAASDLLDIIREVGQLVRANRSTQLKTKFWQTADLLDFVVTVGEARELERRLLTVKLATHNNLIDPNDASTPVSHLLIVSQAYRLTALIMIYRCFPDVLITRMQSRNVEELLGFDPSDYLNNSPDATIDADRSSWLKQLALQTVQLIKTIPLQSHTRCIQPFLLVALSCEVGSLKGMSATNIDTSDTVEAREFIRGRLEAFRHYLPPKPAQVRVDLVLEIWRCLDASEATWYWIDIVIEKNWLYLFG